jgi:hypothetical protein
MRNQNGGPMSQDRAEWQTEIILREQWINLARNDALDALSHGATGGEIIQAVDAATRKPYTADTGSSKSTSLKRVARGTSEAIQRGASVEYIKGRITVFLMQSGALSRDQASKLLGLDSRGLRKLRDDMVSAQREALRQTVDPATFERVYR